MVNVKFLEAVSDEIRMVRSWGAQELFPVSSRFLKPIRFAGSLDNLFFWTICIIKCLWKNDEHVTVVPAWLYNIFIILFKV